MNTIISNVLLAIHLTAVVYLARYAVTLITLEPHERLSPTSDVLALLSFCFVVAFVTAACKGLLWA